MPTYAFVSDEEESVGMLIAGKTILNVRTAEEARGLPDRKGRGRSASTPPQLGMAGAHRQARLPQNSTEDRREGQRASRSTDERSNPLP